MTTRRQRYRDATIDEIKQAALEQIRRSGAADLSLREIGRQIDMSPAGLYRYYDGRDALLTDLIADAFNDLAAAVEAAVTELLADGPADATTRVVEAAAAYRRWGTDQRQRFALIFGTPIPGYAAPEGGATVGAVQRLGAAFGTAVGIESAPGDWDYGTTDLLRQVAVETGAPPSLVQLVMVIWSGVHGLVEFELLGHLDWAITDLDRFFNDQVRRLCSIHRL